MEFSAVFDVPGLPTNTTVYGDSTFCHYIYFNIFFPNDSPSGYGIYNQFVPQVMLGDALSGSSGPPSYEPRWNTFRSYFFQAQYFFAFVDPASNATVLKAVVGETYPVAPGERTWTSFTRRNYSWYLDMGVVGDTSRTSTVVAPTPYMGLLAPHTTSWSEAIYDNVHVNSCWCVRRERHVSYVVLHV